MKSLKEIIDEAMVVEGKCANLSYPRKGNTLYILKKGESKAIKVKVEDIQKVPMGSGYKGSYRVISTLSENPYGIESWTEHVFSSIDYKTHPKQVEILNADGNVFYIGTSKEEISEFAKQTAARRIIGVNERIEKLESELADLYKEKQELEFDINLEISESLK